MYDWLIVGAGLYGAAFAQQMKEMGKTCLVVEKRDHIAGNIYTQNIEGINVHCYGAHIFHTSDKEVWDYVNRFAQFNNYINSPVADYKGKLYNMPFNMNTFYQMWGVTTPAQAKQIIDRQIAESGITEPKNLEEQAISLVGRDIYMTLVKGYTEKQWGRPCDQLPGFIIKRLPVRFRFDNNYFNDRYQGIPEGGYTKMVEKMLDGIDVELDCDFFENRQRLEGMAKRILYTGCIDRYFDFCYGNLEYRSLRFENEILDIDNYQGVAVVNYTDTKPEYTRIIEHKHFEYADSPKTVITKEYSVTWKPGMEPYYPVNDEKNALLYGKYAELAAKEKNVIFGGRLGEYKYYDMDKVLRSALDCARKTENQL